MEWWVIAIVGVIYVIVSKLQVITIRFKDTQEPPRIEEPENDTKQLKK